MVSAYLVAVVVFLSCSIFSVGHELPYFTDRISDISRAVVFVVAEKDAFPHAAKR